MHEYYCMLVEVRVSLHHVSPSCHSGHPFPMEPSHQPHFPFLRSLPRVESRVGGEIAQQYRVLSALLENSGSIPRAHKAARTYLKLQSQWI